ncbi:MAG: hypothetical protein CMK32_08245 [Porticoccaceae bacterium]|nr:hypothetical protein [Porticoccaceae bacterium]
MSWIKIESRTPEIKYDMGIGESDDVLIVHGGVISVGYLYCIEGDDDPPYWKLQGRDGYMAENVTHWMPLPEKPHE